MGQDNGKPIKHGLSIVDTPGEFRLIDKDKLHVDPTYQRDVSQSKVDIIAAGWSWLACGVLGIGLRDGRYYVFDGDHRVLAARQRPDITELPCMVFETNTVKQEAGGFLLTNQFRSPLSSAARFKPQVVVGHPASCQVKELLDAAGYSIVGTVSNGKSIKAIGSMVRSVEMDRDVFLEVWPLILAVSANGPIFERVLTSIFYLQRSLTGTAHSLVKPPWRKRVIALGTAGILNAAARASAYYASGGEKVWARGLAEALNKGVRNRLPDGSELEKETDPIAIRSNSKIAQE